MLTTLNYCTKWLTWFLVFNLKVLIFGRIKNIGYKNKNKNNNKKYKKNKKN